MDILSTAETGYAAEEDELLNFSLDTEEQPEDLETILKGAAAAASSSSYSPDGTTPFRRETRSGSLTEFVEEELEWLSNKDAFPAVETCFFGILSDNPELMVNHQSPVSVLENSSGSSSNRNGNGGTTVANCCRSLKVPSRPRSSSTRKRRTTGFPEWASQQCLWRSQVNKIKSENESSFLVPPFSGITTGSGGISMVKRCLHCQAEKTPQWRAGPMGSKTLCNACGVRFKSGRLLPEYRPANSPTFSTALHSNSHRKVVEMRKHKQVEDGLGGGVMVNEGCGYRSRIDK